MLYYQNFVFKILQFITHVIKLTTAEGRTNLSFFLVSDVGEIGKLGQSGCKIDDVFKIYPGLVIKSALPFSPVGK